MKKKSKAGIVLGITVIIIIVLVVLIILLISMGIGGGSGNGIGSGTANNKVSEASDSERQAEKNIIVIKVEETQILLDETECEDVEELKEQISKLQAQGNDKTFVFEHENAIKATYDEVKVALTDLEDALGINVDYKE